MLYGSGVVVDVHVWEGVRSTFASEKEGIARGVVAGEVSVLAYSHETAVGVL